MNPKHILIENYRGYNIYFDAANERFYTMIDDRKWHEKQSFSAAKKFIDDHVKANYKFEPFDVVKIGTIYNNKGRLKITSIRKDGRFVGEYKDGKKVQISDYEEKDWILDIPENEKHFANIAIFEAEIETWKNKIVLEKKLITASTLEELKPKYIQP